jgi:hypothetical protein
MSMLKRLLASLHSAVFDKSPDSALAFFIRHPDGVRWMVEDEVLTATVGNESRSYDLAAFTVGQLAGQMVLDGFDVEGLSPELAGLSASVLIEGSGNTLNSNGDRLFGFRDLLRSLFGGYARELRIAKKQIGEGLRQLVITQAEGEWLDLWGALYNTPRKPRQSDADYAPIIPREAFRIRVNAFAIELAIWELTGQLVHIEEPWGDMFRLDYSRLSSNSRFFDGSTIGYHLIKPVSDGPINWDGILDIIYRNKAAGVIILPPEEHDRTWIRDALNGTIWQQRVDAMGTLVKYSNLSRLSIDLRLSDHSIEMNYSVAITSLQMLSCLGGVNGDFLPVSLSRLISIGPVVYPDDYAAYTSHSAFARPLLVQMYPEQKMRWRTGGVWRGYQTWRKLYNWAVWSRATSLGSGAYVIASVDGTVISEAREGVDWTIPPSWDDSTWVGAGPGDPTWLVPFSWDGSDW